MVPKCGLTPDPVSSLNVLTMTIDHCVLLFPLQSPLLNNIKKACQEKCHKNNYSKKSMPAQFPEIYGIRIKKNNFHIKQNKQNSHQKIFYCHRLAGITLRFDPAFKIYQLVFGFSFRAQKMRTGDD